MDSELDFFQLLQSLKGSQFFQIFVDCQINTESLKCLNCHHLDVIIPKELYGPRVVFEYNLKNWQKEQNIDVYVSQNQPVAADMNTASNLLDVFEENSLEEISIEGILKSSCVGKQILTFYEINNALDDKYRKLLAKCMVEYLIEKQINPTPKSFETLADNISKSFINENKDMYYIPIKGKKPKGSLYAKYHNSIGKLRKEGLCEPSFKSKTKNINEISFNTEICLPDENQISTKDWLKNNIDPFDEVLEKWNSTYDLRSSFSRGQTTLAEIFDEWPLLQQSFGHKLIDADFSKLYPNTSKLLFEKWEDFSKDILCLIEKQVKDPHSLEILNKFKEAKYNSDIQSCVIVYIIHSLLKPTSRKCSVDPVNPKKKEIFKNFHRRF